MQTKRCFMRINISSNYKENNEIQDDHKMNNNSAKQLILLKASNIRILDKSLLKCRNVYYIRNASLTIE